MLPARRSWQNRKDSLSALSGSAGSTALPYFAACTYFLRSSGVGRDHNFSRRLFPCSIGAPRIVCLTVTWLVFTVPLRSRPQAQTQCRASCVIAWRYTWLVGKTLSPCHACHPSPSKRLGSMRTEPARPKRILAFLGLLLAPLAWCFAVPCALSVLGDVFVDDPVERAKVIWAIDFRFRMYFALAALTFLSSGIIAFLGWRTFPVMSRTTIGFHVFTVAALIASRSL